MTSPLRTAVLCASGMLLGACSAPKVYLPRTPDAQACAQVCGQRYQACRAAPSTYALTPYSAPAESRFASEGEARSCSRQESDCRRACPGASNRPR